MDSEEEEFESISKRCPSESFLDEASLPVLELHGLTTQQRDAAHSTKGVTLQYILYSDLRPRSR